MNGSKQRPGKETANTCKHKQGQAKDTIDVGKDTIEVRKGNTESYMAYCNDLKRHIWIMTQ